MAGSSLSLDTLGSALQPQVGKVHSSCFDSLVREFGAICQYLGYKHSLFGCLYSYPSVVSGILPNHNEGTN